MIKRMCLVVLAAAGLDQPALSEIKGCYERIYDSAHLKKHGAQKVVRLRLQYGFETGPETPEADINGLDFWLRGDRNPRYAIPICETDSKPLRCGLESDRGSFTLEETAGGVRLTNTSYLRAVDPDSEDEGGIELLPDAEHRLFLLPRISTGRCPP